MFSRIVASVSSIMCPTSAPIAPRTTRARTPISSSIADLTRSYCAMEIISTRTAAITTMNRRETLLFLVGSMIQFRAAKLGFVFDNAKGGNHSKNPKAAIWRIIWVIYSLEVSLQLKPSRCSTLQV